MFKLFSSIIIATVVMSGCNSCTSDNERKYGVMQLYGGWTARVDETRKMVKNVEDHYREYLRYEFDSADMQKLSTPYPFWEKVHVYLDESGIRRVKLYSNPEKDQRAEQLYFEDGRLMYSLVITDNFNAAPREGNGKGMEYFFRENTLVLSLNKDGQRRDLSKDSIKMAGIDLLYEAKQIASIISNKQLKP